MKDILYKPELKIDKNYYTEENIKYNVKNDNEKEDILTNIKDNLNDLNNVINKLPQDINQAVKTPFDGVAYVLNQIVTDNLDDKKDIEIIYDIPKNNTNTEVEIPITSFPDDPFSKKNMNQIEVTINTNPIDDITENNYMKDLTTIFDDYIKNLGKTLSHFLANLALIAKECKIDNILKLYGYYSGDTSKIKSPNLKHLSDALIKNQIIREQKLRLYKKLFDIDETINHIRRCHIAYQFKKRYATEEYKKEDLIIDTYQNVILSDLRKEYEKKYDENFFNLYKYLNSSVILIDDCLKILEKEIYAKGILLKEGEVLYDIKTNK